MQLYYIYKSISKPQNTILLLLPSALLPVLQFPEGNPVTFATHSLAA